MKVTLVALNAHYMHTSLAIRQIGPALERAGWQVNLIEGHINMVYRDLLERIAREAGELVGFSCYIWNIDYVMRLARALRVARRDIKIALGGPEAAYRARELLKRETAVDFVLTGEGERIFPMLADCVARGNAPFGVPGAAFRQAGEAVENPPPGPLSPEEWPDVYAGGASGLENRILYIETSRGCPYRCSYCLSSAQGAVRALDADESVRRLTHLAGCGAKLIKLVDRTFNFDRARARAIWRGLIEHARATGFAGTYHFEIGAHLIGEEDLRVLSQAPAGLFQFEAGIQSTHADTLSAVSRAAAFEDLAGPLRAMRALGNIHLHVDLIAGLPGEDMAGFEKSFDDAFKLGAHQLQLGFLKLLYGTKLREQADRLGLRFDPGAPYEIIETAQMRFDQLCHLKDVERALDWYVNSSRYRASTRYLLQGCAPFKLLSGMALRMRAAGVFDAERAEKSRAAALIQFAPDTADRAVLALLVRHDLLLAGRRRDLPAAAEFAESEAERALLRERFHPVRGQSACTYPFDPELFLRQGVMRAGACTIVYDPPRAERV